MKTVIGLFTGYADAHCAIEELRRRGIEPAQISAATRSRSVHERCSNESQDARHPLSDDMSIGAAGGMIFGGVAGLLSGISALAVPGIGTAYAFGTVLSALAGTAVGIGAGAVVGGLCGVFVGWRLNGGQAAIPAGGARRREVFVVVRVPDEVEMEAAGVMRNARARQRISPRAIARQRPASF